MTILRRLAVIVAVMLTIGAAAQVNPLWMRFCAISPDGETIVFSYKGDLFTVPVQGGTAHQVTSNDAYDAYPVWSPDGQRIAFASAREGSLDVYIVGKDGGTPKRLTTDSGNETPLCFLDNKTVLFEATNMPTSRSILFASSSFPQVYQVSTDGGRAHLFSELPMQDLSINSRGDVLYHDIKGYEDPFRKHHTSSITRDIWLKQAGKFSKLTSFNGEDRTPRWAADGNAYYYLSEQDGTFNVYKNTIGGQAKQLTRHTKHPVRYMTVAGNGTLCYSYNGEIYTLHEGGEPQKVNITINADRSEKELIRQIKKDGATAISVSPSGKEVAFVMHGDVYVTSVDYSTTKQITDSPEQERTIDFSQCIRQDGEQDFHHFSFLPSISSTLPQRPCWIVHTNEQVHDVLRKGLPQSPLYNGQITSIGPRYCPSIETKIVTFADKASHQLFIEPEGATTHEMYLNGFSSSLPWEIQFEALRHIPALRNVHAFRPGYAIEYDFFDPTQLTHTLESKLVKNLFLAGQVNGTTGYEEAAGQGLVAGINAHQNVTGGAPFTLARNEAYIGVLIDDLVTCGVDEPYRMFTSRAEHRILLRQDDADMRLTEKGYSLGLVTRERYNLMLSKRQQMDDLVAFCREYTVKTQMVNPLLEAKGMQPLSQGQRLHELLLRPQLSIKTLAQALPEFQAKLEVLDATRRGEIIEAAEVAVKYRGYIERESLIADRVSRLENVTLKGKFDYSKIRQLSTEARQKLKAIDPETVGQASRIPGVSPSDINILLVLLGR
mgnify:CR=1 FL=1